MRPLLLCLCAAIPALPQFRELSTTGDGSELYFTTELRRRGSRQPQDPKLFQLRAAGLSLVSTEGCDVVRLTGRCGIDDVQVSGDGTTAIYQSRVPCQGGSSCVLRELALGTLIGPAGRQTFDGRIRISRNARFMVHHDTSGAPSMSARISRLHDHESGTITELPRFIGPAVKVAEDGTVLTSTGLLVTPHVERQAAIPHDASAVDMDDRARVVISQTRNRRRLYVTGVLANRYWQLGPDDRDSYDGSISADGEWALYISVIGDTPQLFFSRVDGSDWRQLTVTGEGVQEATLSGNGRVALAVTGAGAVFRIDTFSGAAAEIIGRTPRDLKRSGAPTPGSMNILTGAGLAPSPSGAEVTIDGVPMLLQSVSPAQIVFQIPWELPVAIGPSRPSSLVLSTANEYFETSIPVSLTAIIAETMAVVHQDFASLVTNEKPARPGEIVHLYATGLGPVEPPVASGIAGPARVLSRATTTWEFTWLALSVDRAPADVLFAGLAPGMIGVYQIDARVPSPAPHDGVLWAKHPNGFVYTFATIPVSR